VPVLAAALEIGELVPVRRTAAEVGSWRLGRTNHVGTSRAAARRKIEMMTRRLLVET